MNTIADRLTASLGDRYRLERELGQGGMATVYLAQDLKHDRKVAIKVLKPELAAVLGAERFVQEIKTTAALSHPHILPLFDSGEAGGFLYYVMPYIEGETVREKLSRERQFGITEAVKIATEVADALDYAHRHGVIHRDIKPENILLHDGRPMVMDFGIALAVSAAAGGRMTETGLSLGTPHYMSPEQATADRDITGRSDIYSLASVLYEMLSGEPPHMGTSAQQIIMKIIAEPVKPVTELRKSVPPNVTAAVAKALEKLPADRFDSAKQFAEALTNPAFTTVTSGTGGLAAARSGYPRVLVGALGLVAIVATALGAWGWLRPAPGQPVTRFLVSVPDDLPMSILRNGNTAFDISRDASLFAYIGSSKGEAPRVFVRPMGSFDVLPVAGSENADGFAISPDGREVVVKVGHELWRTGWSGEEPRIVADSAQYGPLWGDDGFIYFTAMSGDLVRAPAGGGRRERVVAAMRRGALRWTDILPDGRGALYAASPPVVEGGEPAIRIADFSNDSTKEFGPGQFALYRSGRLVIARADGSVWAAPFGLKRLATTQDLIAVARHQATFATDSWQGMAVSATGTLLYRSAAGPGVSPVRVRRDGRETPYPFAAPFSLGPRLSPEGARLVSTMAEGTASDISIVNLSDGTTTRLTFDGASAYPDWSPDGKRVAWYTIVNGAYELRWRAADASSPTAPLMRGPSRPIEVVFLPGGRAFIAREGDRSSSENAELVRYDMVGDSLVKTPLTSTAANERSPLVSPDGRYVAYVSDESGVDQVYVRETRPSENVWPVSRDGGLEPLWSRSGRELFYRNRGRLVRVGVRTVPTFAVTEAAQDLFPVGEYALNMNHTGYGILPGDEEFVFIKVTTPLNRLVIVTNWMDEVNALLAGGR